MKTNSSKVVISMKKTGRKKELISPEQTAIIEMRKEGFP